MPATANVTFSPAAGTYIGAQSVTLACVTGGAVIFYTTDGSTPTNSGGTTPTGTTKKYTAPIPLTAGVNVTIKANAIASGDTISATTSATYQDNGGQSAPAAHARTSQLNSNARSAAIPAAVRNVVHYVPPVRPKSFVK